MLDQLREKFKWLERGLAKIFAGLPFTPNQYTAFSLVCAVACACLLIDGYYRWATAAFALATISDLVDGSVARAKNLVSVKGAYWDTVSDRYVEAIVLFGFLFAPIPGVYLPAAAWIFLALVGSLMTTYAKSAAKEKGLSDAELKGGLMSRAERVFMLLAIFVILPFNPLSAAYLFVLLAVLSNLTAVQRIMAALGRQ